MKKYYIGPPQKKSPAVFEDNEGLVKKKVNYHNNDTYESQDENIHYCPWAFRKDVEHKINMFLGITNYSVTNFALAHGLGEHESARALDTLITVAETLYE